MLHYAGESDTIAAIATAPGKSGIAVVKISGPRSVSIMRTVFRGNSPPENYDRTMVYGHIMDGDDSIDDVLVCVMKTPKSYTGEDVVEIQTHGGSAAAGITLGLLVDAGAKVAEPGEFTRRAFLNGKIDLVQAEAVMEIVAAEGREYLKQAEHLMDGTFTTRIEQLLENLRESGSLLELNIEFLHQGLEAIKEHELVVSLDKTIASLTGMISSYGAARRIKEGITVVLAGNVNSGKSSLFNVLLGKSRSIVNPAPGTTRDWIEEKIDFDGLPVNLIDTAGIRETPDEIEQEGVTKTGHLMKKADIVLYLTEATECVPGMEFPGQKNDRYIHIASKSDLYNLPPKRADIVYVSSLTGEGIQELSDVIINRARSCISYKSTDTLVLLERHRSELTAARNALERARESIGTWSEEIISLEIHEAQKHIEAIVGKNIDFDVIDSIFSNFCIGK